MLNTFTLAQGEICLKQPGVTTKNRNKHHWHYWVKSDGHAVPMPRKYVKQMVADWRGLGRQAGFDRAGVFYAKTKHRMVLHKKTKSLILDIMYGEILND